MSRCAMEFPQSSICKSKLSRLWERVLCTIFWTDEIDWSVKFSSRKLVVTKLMSTPECWAHLPTLSDMDWPVLMGLLPTLAIPIMFWIFFYNFACVRNNCDSSTRGQELIQCGAGCSLGLTLGGTALGITSAVPDLEEGLLLIVTSYRNYQPF